LVVNGAPQFLPLNAYHTDIFWSFQDLDADVRKELIVAYPQDDGDCHYCPQTWVLATFEMIGARFSPDLDFPPFELEKARGFGLPAIHGYQYVPLTGLFFPMWAPSWLQLSSPGAAFSKARFRSAAVEEVIARYSRIPQ
jgi:hypothetical protein